MKHFMIAIGIIGLLATSGCNTTANTGDNNTDKKIRAFTVDDHDTIQTLLRNSQWCMVYKNTKTKMPVTFNADVTLMNEGTAAEESVELKKNELHYLDPNTPTSNYTRFEAEYSGYLLTHAVYANGVAEEEVRFYKNPSDAQAWIDTL